MLARRLMPAVLEAGRCLMRCRAEGVTAEQKGDGSPVSRADREAEAILLAGLAHAAPEVPVIAEEAVSAGHIPAFGTSAFLVDALDGTKEYLRGSDDFTVNVALVEAGVPTFGIVLAPASGRLFATTQRGVAAAARLSPESLRVGTEQELAEMLVEITTKEPDPGAIRVVTSRSNRSPQTEQFLARFRVGSDERFGSSLKFGLIAAGEADLYPRHGPTSAWDIAAGHAVLSAAGGLVTTPDGAPLRYLDRTSMTGAEPFLNPHFIAWGRPSLMSLL